MFVYVHPEPTKVHFICKRVKEDIPSKQSSKENKKMCLEYKFQMFISIKYRGRVFRAYLSKNFIK